MHNMFTRSIQPSCVEVYEVQGKVADYHNKAYIAVPKKPPTSEQIARKSGRGYESSSAFETRVITLDDMEYSLVCLAIKLLHVGIIFRTDVSVPYRQSRYPLLGHHTPQDDWITMAARVDLTLSPCCHLVNTLDQSQLYCGLSDTVSSSHEIFHVGNGWCGYLIAKSTTFCDPLKLFRRNPKVCGVVHHNLNTCVGVVFTELTKIPFFVDVMPQELWWYTRTRHTAILLSHVFRLHRRWTLRRHPTM
jgi:hypothetical protein